MPPAERAGRIHYGWWIVGACVLAAMTGNALGLFGAGVYLSAVIASTGWATSTVSGAVTLFYVVSAFLLIPVGSGIGRIGPRPFVAMMIAGFVIGVFGHIAKAKALVALGIGLIFLATFVFPLVANILKSGS